MKKRYENPITEIVTIQMIQMVALSTANILFGNDDVNADWAQSRMGRCDNECNIWDDNDYGQSDWLQQRHHLW